MPRVTRPCLRFIWCLQLVLLPLLTSVGLAQDTQDAPGTPEVAAEAEAKLENGAEVIADVAAAKNDEKEDAPLRVGMILPLTGDFSFFGYQATIGASIAVKEINLQGERQIEVLYEDSTCKPAPAVSAYKRLTEQEKVDVLLGPACTGAIMAIAPIAQKTRRPFIALLDAGTKVSKAGDQVYSIGFSSEDEGHLVAEYLNRNQLSRVGIIYEEDQWATLVKDAFKERFVEGGGIVVAEESQSVDNKDYRPTILKVIKQEPQALFIAPAFNGGHVLNQLRELKVKLPIVGPDTFGTQEVLTTAEKNAEGVIFANVKLAEENEVVQRLRKLVELDYDESIHSLLFVAFGYDAVRLAYRAMKENVDLHDGLSRIRYEDGVIPINGFDENGMVKLKPQLMQVVRGKFVDLEEKKKKKRKKRR